MFNLAKIYYDEEERNDVKDHFKSLDLLIKSSEMGFNPSFCFILIIWLKKFKLLNSVLIEKELKKHLNDSTKLAQKLYDFYLILVDIPPEIKALEYIIEFIKSNYIFMLYNGIAFTSNFLNDKKFENEPPIVQKMMKIDDNFIERFGI